MRVLEVSSPGVAALRERASADREVGPGQLLVGPDVVGVCATDLEIVDGSLVYLRTGQSRFPMVPGHEWTGRVLAAGEDVVGISAGDRVVGECSIGCGSCTTCAAGAYHQCPDRRETGILGMDGALAEQLTFPARAAHVVAPEMDPLDAALIEPLAVAFRAVNRAQARRGEAVLVVGAGTIGALVVEVLTQAVDCEAFVADGRRDRVERALSLGAEAHPSRRRYTTVIEATGTAAGIGLAHTALAAGGTLVVVGLTGQKSVPLDLDAIVVNDHRLVGSLGSPGVWPEVISLVQSGTVRPASLVTDSFTLDEWEVAFERVRRAAPGQGKVVIRQQPAGA